MRIELIHKVSMYERFLSSDDEGQRALMLRVSNFSKRKRKEHETQQRSLDRITEEILRQGHDLQVTSRGNAFSFDNKDLVIAGGGDGTILAAAHYVQSIPILAVNFDPDTSVGFFCAADINNFADALKNYESLPRTELQRILLTLNGERLPEMVLNDVWFASKSQHAKCFYELNVDGERSREGGNGLLVASPAGATGRMYHEGGEVVPLDFGRLQYLIDGKRGEEPKFADEIELISQTYGARLVLDTSYLSYPCSVEDRVIMQLGDPVTILGDLASKREVYR